MKTIIKYVKLIVVTALIAGSLVPLVSNASGGCGVGWHRGPYGGCRPNGPGWVSTRPWAVPNY